MCFLKKLGQSKQSIQPSKQDINQNKLTELHMRKVFHQFVPETCKQKGTHTDRVTEQWLKCKMVDGHNTNMSAILDFEPNPSPISAQPEIQILHLFGGRPILNLFHAFVLNCLI